jgi:hypothetical protein
VLGVREYSFSEIWIVRMTLPPVCVSSELLLLLPPQPASKSTGKRIQARRIRWVLRRPTPFGFPATVSWKPAGP